MIKSPFSSRTQRGVDLIKDEQKKILDYLAYGQVATDSEVDILSQQILIKKIETEYEKSPKRLRTMVAD